MFMGEYRHSLDAKNRMIIPAKFRDELGNTFVVTKGLDGCLTVYTSSQWAKIIEQLEKLPTTKKEARQYVRYLTSKASECELDPILHEEIVQRAVELAKAAWTSTGQDNLQIVSQMGQRTE